MLIIVGVDYRTIVDGTLDMRADAFRQNQWDPSTPNFARYGKRYLKKSGMYEYKQLENTPAGAHYTYKGIKSFRRLFGKFVPF